MTRARRWPWRNPDAYHEPPTELLDQLATACPCPDPLRAVLPRCPIHGYDCTPTEPGEVPWFRHPDGPEANAQETP